MDIRSFESYDIPAAAALFLQSVKALRQKIPALPPDAEDGTRFRDYLARLANGGGGVVALDGGKLVGYLGWFLVDGFRGTDRKAAYCPEWAHGAAESAKPAIYRALYRAACTQWSGCHAHAITLLAHDDVAVQTWFWNGFGLTVVDAVRSMTPLTTVRRSDVSVRKSTLDDVETLAVIEAEHWQHYAQPPVLMAAHDNDDAAAFAALLDRSDSDVWIAEGDGEPAGYMRFEANSHGAAVVVSSEKAIAITGAYTRPAFRGKGAAVTLLNAALQDYAGRGFTCCSVDFESFNPEAAAFWMKHFEPVCYSVVRVPEISEWPR